MPRQGNQQLNRLGEQIHFATQSLRVMLWNFAVLTPIYTRLRDAHNLKAFVGEAIAPLLAYFCEAMGDEWMAPRVPTATQEAYEGITQDCQSLGVPQQMMAWIVGRQPLHSEFLEFLSPRNVVGIYNKGGDNFLMVFRQMEGSMRLTYYMTTITNQKLRSQEVAQRITYDRRPPPGIVLSPKGEGKGKGKDQGKGDRPGKGKGGGKKGRSRSPRQLRPVGAAAPVHPAPPPADPVAPAEAASAAVS